MLTLTNVSTLIGGFRAIHDLSLEIAPGEFVALLGGNGAGKTTLFRTIAGLIHPISGTIMFRGEEIHKNQPTKLWGSAFPFARRDDSFSPNCQCIKISCSGPIGAATKRESKNRWRKCMPSFPF